jgi:phage FluMu protein Com
MAKGTTLHLGFDCPACGVVNILKCRNCGEVFEFDPRMAPGEKRIRKAMPFEERFVTRAKTAPGAGGPLGFLRMAGGRFISGPPHRLRRPSMTTKGASAVNAQTSFGGRRTRRQSAS